MNCDHKKRNIIKNSLLFILLRDALPYKTYTLKNFNSDKEKLVDHIKECIERKCLGIDDIIYQKEEKEQLFLDEFLMRGLNHAFKKIIKEEYYRYFKSSIPQKKRLQILERDNYKCQYCGADLRKIEEKGFSAQIDHIKSKRAGGKDNFENLVASCWECNIGKRDYDFFEYDSS
jgi:predicted restriction endonuclease